MHWSACTLMSILTRRRNPRAFNVLFKADDIGEISSYTLCNLLKLLTNLVEKSLFAPQEILDIIEGILRDVHSESVAAQCLASASTLLRM